MKMHRLLIAMVIAGIMSSAALSDETIELAKNHLQEIVYTQIATKVEARLEGSALPPNEVESKIAGTAAGYSECVVEFFVSRQEEEFKVALTLLASGASDEEMRKELGDNHKSAQQIVDANILLVEACFLKVQQDQGIPGEGTI